MNRSTTPAASVLLVRGDPLEVYTVRRADSLRFFGGFFAFPGGRVHASDAEIGLDSHGKSAWQVDEELPYVVAAVRELFEETGILLARKPDGAFPRTEELQDFRRLLTQEKLNFADVLRELGLVIRLSDLCPLGRLVTPPFTAMRFDTAFFLVQVPPNQEASVWPGELQEGAWLAPTDLLSRWERGECLVSPPTVTILQALRNCSRAQALGVLVNLVRQATDRDTHLIYFSPDVLFIPLRCAALPPSTHTNAYVVGAGPVYLIDPGPVDSDEQRHLFAVLDAYRASGRPLTAVVLSHHHPDHIGAATICAERYGIPIWSHPRTAELLRGNVNVSREIHDGDLLPLGVAADGFAQWHLRAIHTPGHASGHLAFHDPHYGLLFTGDMVSTQTSVVIAPPDGDLAVYLDSLRRLREYAGRLLLPSHGGPTARSRQTLEEAVEHRRQREEMLIRALHAEPKSVQELAVEIYKGVPENLMKFARLQTLAGLRKLHAEGRVTTDGTGERWIVCEGGRPGRGSG